MEESFGDRIAECYLSKINKLTLEKKHCELLKEWVGEIAKNQQEIRSKISWNNLKMDYVKAGEARTSWARTETQWHAEAFAGSELSFLTLTIFFSLWCAWNKKSSDTRTVSTSPIVLRCKGRVNINQTRCKWEANIYLKKPLSAGLGLEISALTRSVGMTQFYGNYSATFTGLLT